MELRHENILITAGTQRIGFELLQESLAMGYNVIAHYRSRNDQARAWLETLPLLHNRVHFIQQDLSESPEMLIEKATRFSGKLVGLVNNASVFSKGNLSDSAHLTEMLNIHFHIPNKLSAHFCKTVASGWIVNITDAIIQRPNHTFQNYRISKLFLNELTRQQASLYAPNFRVNAIAPGAILPSAALSAESFDSLAEKIPLKKTGPIQSVANTFRFLVGNDYCTGQIIAVDGGWHLTA